MPHSIRRNILRGTLAGSALSLAVAAGLLRPGRAFAETVLHRQLLDSLSALRSSPVETSNAIRIDAPEIAVDGNTVFMTLFSTLPEVDMLAVFADRNPQPLIASFQLAPEVLPFLAFRVKLATTSNLWVFARSRGRFYKNARAVKVTVGGCGAGLN